jgi:hypothetical protein
MVLPYALSMFFPVSPSLGCMALLAERLIPEKKDGRPPSGFEDVDGTLGSSEGVGGGRGVDFGSAISDGYVQAQVTMMSGRYLAHQVVSTIYIPTFASCSQ